MNIPCAIAIKDRKLSWAFSRFLNIIDKSLHIIELDGFEHRDRDGLPVTTILLCYREGYKPSPWHIGELVQNLHDFDSQQSELYGHSGKVGFRQGVIF